MNFEQQIAQLVADHQKAAYGWDVTADELLRDHPWHMIVAWSWDANVYFKHRRWYSSLEEAEIPEVGEMIFVREKDRVSQYIWRGRWVHAGGMTESMYK